MKRVLLDYPWSISDTLNGDSPAWNVMQSFDNLLKSRRLDAVPFLTYEQLEGFYSGTFRGTGSAWANIAKLASGLVRWNTEQKCQSSPVTEVSGLSGDWKCSLRDSMKSLDDWRCPQIVISESRQNQWPREEEVAVRLEACGDLPASGPVQRVLVKLEEYDLHPHAVPDFDPWNLTSIHPIENPQIPHLAHPCLLPKPPGLSEIPLEEVAQELRQLKQRDGSRFYYIPPRTWQPAVVTKERWRSGRAFPYDEIDGHKGFIDVDGSIWEWDSAERHWDVQLKPYRRISHTGDEIGGSR